MYQTKIYSELVSGLPDGKVTDHTQVKDVNLSDVISEAFRELINSGTLTPGHKYRITDPANLPYGYLDACETMSLTDGTVIVEAVDGSHLKPLMTETGYSELYRLAKDGKLCPGARYLITDYTNMGRTSQEQIIPGVSMTLGRVQNTKIITEALDRHTLSDKAKYVIGIQEKTHYFDCTYRMGVPQTMRDTYGWCYGDSPMVTKPGGKIRTADGFFDTLYIQTGKREQLMIYIAGTQDSTPSLTEETLFEFYTEGEALHVPQRRIGDYLYDCWGRHSGIVTWLKDDLGNEAPFDFYNLAFYISDPELSGLFGSSAAQYYPLFKSDTGSNWYNSLTGKDRRNYYNNVFKTISPIILDCSGTHDNCFDNATGRIESGYNLKIVNSKVRLYHTTDLDIKDGAIRGECTSVTIQGDGKGVWCVAPSVGGTYLQTEDRLTSVAELTNGSETPLFYAELYRKAVLGQLTPGSRYLIRDGLSVPLPENLPVGSPDSQYALPYGIVVTARDAWTFFDDAELRFNENAARACAPYIDLSKFRIKYDFFGTSAKTFWLEKTPFVNTANTDNVDFLESSSPGLTILAMFSDTCDAASLEYHQIVNHIYIDTPDLASSKYWGFYDLEAGYDSINGVYTVAGCESLDADGAPLCKRYISDLKMYLASTFRGVVYEFEDDLGNRAGFDFYNLYKRFTIPALPTLSNTRPLDTYLIDMTGTAIPPTGLIPLFADYEGNHVLLDPASRTYYTGNRIIGERLGTRFVGDQFTNVTAYSSDVIFSRHCTDTDVRETSGYICGVEECEIRGGEVNIMEAGGSRLYGCIVSGNLKGTQCELYNVNDANIVMTPENRMSHYALYGNGFSMNGSRISITGNGTYNVNPDLSVTKTGDTATAMADGLMSKEDKAKMDAIPLIIYVPNESSMPETPEDGVLYLIGEE